MSESEELKPQTPGQKLLSLARDLDLAEADSELDDDDDFRGPRGTRDMQKRREEDLYYFRPAEHLPDPPQIEGWVHRWIRVKVSANGSDSDANNMNKAMREGWRPAPPLEYPELVATLFGRSDESNIIEFGGLVLCRIQKERADARTRYYEDLAKKQLGSVNQRLTEYANDDRLQFHAKSRTDTKNSLE